MDPVNPAEGLVRKNLTCHCMTHSWKKNYKTSSKVSRSLYLLFPFYLALEFLFLPVTDIRIGHTIHVTAFPLHNDVHILERCDLTLSQMTKFWTRPN